MATPYSQSELEQLAVESRRFSEQYQTLLLSTTDSDGRPDASYAPYLEVDGHFYLFISDLATHTKNLRQQPFASVMFIENEELAEHPFARKRLVYQCQAEFVENSAANYESLLEQMTNRFGALMQTLRSLSDFHLLRLEPTSGTFVAGFGKAFDVDPQQDGKLSHIRPGQPGQSVK